jgi:dTDP-4-amino-4,6-dideoxygalactose transaminase
MIDADEFGVSRDGLHDSLAIHGIYTRKYFYPLVTDFESYRDQFDSTDTPVAARLSNAVLTLPMYADLHSADVHRICDAILSVGVVS